jgi:hypothetical protein
VNAHGAQEFKCHACRGTGVEPAKERPQHRLTSEQERLYDRLYELAEDAGVAGLSEEEVVRAVTEGYGSFEVDQSMKDEGAPE